MPDGLLRANAWNQVLIGNGSVHHWVCEDIVARSGNTIMNTKHTKVLFALGGYELIDLFDA